MHPTKALDLFLNAPLPRKEHDQFNCICSDIQLIDSDLIDSDPTLSAKISETLSFNNLM